MLIWIVPKNEGKNKLERKKKCRHAKQFINMFLPTILMAQVEKSVCCESPDYTFFELHRVLEKMSVLFLAMSFKYMNRFW